MKNIYKLLGIAALALLFAFASCSNPSSGNSSSTPAPPKVIAAAYVFDSSSKIGKQALNLNLSGGNRSAGRAAIDLAGATDYELVFMGVTISSGTVSQSGTVYTFTPTGGSTFTFDTATNTFTGSITLNSAAKAELKALKGGDGKFIDQVAKLEFFNIMQAPSSSDTSWTGTWIQAYRDQSVNDTNLSNTFTTRLVFSGNTYQVLNGSTVVERGTFVYLDPQKTSGVEQLFIFFRTTASGLEITPYYYEGFPQTYNPGGGLGITNAFIQFFNDLVGPHGVEA